MSNDLSDTTKALLDSFTGWDQKYAGVLDVYGEGLIYASVCTSLDDAAADQAMAERPATGSRGWTRSTDSTFAGGQTNPCPCEEHPDTHRHILYEA